MVQISAAAPGPLGKIKCHWPYGDPWRVPWHWEHMSWGPEAGVAMPWLVAQKGRFRKHLIFPQPRTALLI